MLTIPPRVVRGSRPPSSTRAAAISAARMESPESVLGMKIEPMRPRRWVPTRPSPSMSAPEGSTVEREVSITITMSNCRSSPAMAAARPATKMPQIESATVLPGGGYSMTICIWVGAFVLRTGGPPRPGETIGGAGAAGLGTEAPWAAKEESGWPAPFASGRSRAASTPPIGAAKSVGVPSWGTWA